MSTNDTTATSIPADDESAASKPRNLAPAPGMAPAADTSATPPTQPGNVSVATTPNLTTMNTNQNNTVPADDESAAIVSATATNALAPGSILSSGTPADSMGEGAATQSFSGASFSIPEGGATVKAKLTVDDSGSLSVSGPSGFTISASLPDGEWTNLDDASYWQTEEEHFLKAGSYDVSGSVTNNDMSPWNENNRMLARYEIEFVSSGIPDPVPDPSSSSSSSSGYKKEVGFCDPCSCGDENTDGDADHGQSDPAPSPKATPLPSLYTFSPSETNCLKGVSITLNNIADSKSSLTHLFFQQWKSCLRLFFQQWKSCLRLFFQQRNRRKCNVANR